jgi:hypothetical protein
MTAAISGLSWADERLALDHRGHGQQLVGGHVQAARAAISLAPKRSRRTRAAALPPACSRRARVHVVGRREQEAFEIRRPAWARRSERDRAAASAARRPVAARQAVGRGDLRDLQTRVLPSGITTLTTGGGASGALRGPSRVQRLHERQQPRDHRGKREHRARRRAPAANRRRARVAAGSGAAPGGGSGLEPADGGTSGGGRSTAAGSRLDRQRVAAAGRGRRLGDRRRRGGGRHSRVGRQVMVPAGIDRSGGARGAARTAARARFALALAFLLGAFARRLVIGRREPRTRTLTRSSRQPALQQVRRGARVLAVRRTAPHPAGPCAW